MTERFSSLAPLENYTSFLIGRLEHIKTDFKKLDISDLERVHKKYVSHGKLTLGMVVQEMKGMGYGFFDYLSVLEAKFIPFLETEINRLSISDSKQPLDAFRNVNVANPYKYLEQLPKDLCFLGKDVLMRFFKHSTDKRLSSNVNRRSYEHLESEFKKFSYFTIDLFGFFYMYENLNSDFKGYLRNYLNDLERALDNLKRLLETQIDINQPID